MKYKVITITKKGVRVEQEFEIKKEAIKVATDLMNQGMKVEVYEINKIL